MLYMVTFAINIPPMLAYNPYMDPMGNERIFRKPTDFDLRPLSSNFLARGTYLQRSISLRLPAGLPGWKLSNRFVEHGSLKLDAVVLGWSISKKREHHSQNYGKSQEFPLSQKWINIWMFAKSQIPKMGRKNWILPDF